MSPSANPEWIPEIPEEEQFTFDLEQAKEILEAAGYKDGNGNGIREDEGDGHHLDYYILSDSQTAARQLRVRHRLAEGDRDRHDASRS